MDRLPSRTTKQDLQTIKLYFSGGREMTHGPERGDTAEELFWLQWNGLMKRLTEDERDLVDEMLKRTREDAYAEAESNIRSHIRKIRELK
jgi:hypothetical protein